VTEDTDLEFLHHVLINELWVAAVFWEGGGWLVQHNALVAGSPDLTAPLARAHLNWQLHDLVLTKLAQS
jgi:hypothetical protein